MPQQQNLLDRLRGFLKLVSNHSDTSETAKLEAYLVLQQLSSQDLIWRSEYESWEALLEGEGVTAASWRRFKRSYEVVQDVATIRRHGFRTMQKLGTLRRDLMAKAARKLMSEPPATVFKAVQVKAPKSQQTHARLREYIESLEAKLKSLGESLPKAPWA